MFSERHSESFCRACRGGHRDALPRASWEPEIDDSAFFIERSSFEFPIRPFQQVKMSNSWTSHDRPVSDAYRRPKCHLTVLSSERQWSVSLARWNGVIRKFENPTTQEKS